MGRKNATLIGLFILFLATISLGLLSYINYENWVLFMSISVLSRFV
jgi:hypothetical protein